MISLVQAEKLNQGTSLVQTCNNCTYCSATLYYPNNTMLLNNVSMTKTGSVFNYSLSSGQVNIIGEYCWYYNCGNAQESDTGEICFDVTSTGFQNLTSLYFIILGLGIVFIVMGFVIKDAWITILGTFGLYAVGLFIIIYGIEPLKNLYLTRAIGLVVLGIAMYISINSAIEVIEEEL